MTNKVINFSELGREEIRCIIYTDENGITKAERSLNGIKILKETLDNPIIVYNIDNKTQGKLQTIIGKARMNKGKKDLFISARELILDYIPLCTNIVLDLDAERDKEKIENIINSPKKYFELAITEVSNIVSESSISYDESVKAFGKLPKEEQEKMIEEAKKASKVIKETEEEKELREAEESVIALKEKMKQSKLSKLDDVEIIDVEEIVSE